MGGIMEKKLIKRYVLLCLPFICGIGLYLVGFINIVSSLLLFGGGYITVKNLFDYRIIKRSVRKVSHIDKIGMENIYKVKTNDEINSNVIDFSNNMNRYRSYDSIPGFKRTRRYIKVRRRIK